LSAFAEQLSVRRKSEGDGMSACDDYRSMVPLFMDDELRGYELQDFQRHIGECAECKRVLAQEQALSHLLHRNRPLYHAPEVLRASVSRILSSEAHAGLRVPDRLRRRVLRMLTSPLRNTVRPAFRWKQMVAFGLLTALIFFFIPPTVQRVRANAFVETAAATHRSYLEGNLPMELRTSSPADVTAWFAGKVPFHFQLPESQQTASGQQIYWLVGSRLVNFEGTYAALTTYETRQQKVSLLVVSDRSARAEGGEEVQSGRLTFHDHTVGGLNVITWSNHGLTYALVSSLPRSARQSCLVCHQNMADRLNFSHQP
jgi:anti-sigma factor RsiW